MTPPNATDIKTGLVRASDLSLEELLARRGDGDTVLDHCLRRVVGNAASGSRKRVAAFNAASPRKSADPRTPASSNASPPRQS